MRRNNNAAECGSLRRFGKSVDVSGVESRREGWKKSKQATYGSRETSAVFVESCDGAVVRAVAGVQRQPQRAMMREG